MTAEKKEEPIYYSPLQKKPLQFEQKTIQEQIKQAVPLKQTFERIKIIQMKTFINALQVLLFLILQSPIKLYWEKLLSA